MGALRKVVSFGPVLALLAGTLAAQTPAGSEAATDAGIAGAQREFQTIREHQTSAPGTTKLELPRISAPAETTAPSPAPVIMPRDRETLLLEKKKAERAKNWLVDAVMHDADDATGRDADAKSKDATKLDPALAADPFAQLIAEQKQRAREDERARAGERSPAESGPGALTAPPPNPLAGYMAAWISPQDHELLLPKPENSSAAALPGLAGVDVANRPTSDRGPANDLFVPGVDDFKPAADANPYLAPPLPAPPATAPASGGGAPDLVPPAADTFHAPPAMSGPAPVEREKSVAPPGLAKPEDDAKYFPQLKRF